MASVTYYFDFGENYMGDAVDYTTTVYTYGDTIPSNAVITSATYSFTVGISSGYSGKTIKLKKIYVNGSTSYLYGSSGWLDASNRVYFEGSMTVGSSSPAPFTGDSFDLLLNVDWGSSSLSGVNGRDGSITINYTTPYYTTAPGAPSISQQPNGTLNASWSAAATNPASTISYELWEANSGGRVASAGTSLSVSGVTIPNYGSPIEFYVVANSSTAGTYAGGRTSKTFAVPSLSTPTNVKLSAATGESTTISWTASTISNSTGTITYSIRKNGTEIKTTTDTSFTFEKDVTSTWGASAVTLTVKATATTVNQHYQSLESGVSSGVSFTYKAANPTFTSYPVLSRNPTSGASTTISWTAAGVENQNGATIYYQYFVGPSSTHSDSYHVGTTTSLSATISESNIISKCGSGFGASTSGSTCYLFVRAYWQMADGTQGGWHTPTGVAFTYYPTVNAPTNVKISPTSGITTTVTWTNVAAGNGSQPQAILMIDGANVVTGITNSSGGYAINKDVWRNYETGAHTIAIAHEWYGRTATSGTATFTYESGLLKYYDGTQWKQCEVYYYDSSMNTWKLCMPHYYTNDGWKKCSS